MTIIIIKMLMSLTMIMHEDETHYHQDVDEFDNDYALGWYSLSSRCWWVWQWLCIRMLIIIIKMLRCLTMNMYDDDNHYHQDVEKFDNDYSWWWLSLSSRSWEVWQWLVWWWHSLYDDNTIIIKMLRSFKMIMYDDDGIWYYLLPTNDGILTCMMKSDDN